MRLPTRRALLCAPLALAVLNCGLAPAPAADASNPGVIPVQAKANGLTYGDWSARHWKWLFSMPVDEHPLFGTADVSEGQSGEVWFLGGSFASTELVPGVFIAEETRDVTIPPGKKLFFPIVDSEASTVEGNGATEEELREAAQFFSDFIVLDSLFCEVDGRPVKNLADFRVQSPLFTFGPLPDNNILEAFGVTAPEGTKSKSVSDGVFVMLATLSAGTHTVHFGGVSDLTSVGGPIFIQDITYNITVKK